MKSQFAAGCAIGLAMLLAGCSDTPAPPVDTSAADLKAIKDGEVTWSAAFGAKDVDKIVSYYADDASLLTPGAPIMMGKDAIRSGVRDLMSDKSLSMSFTTSTAAVSKSGDLAYTQGTYSMTKTIPKTKKVVTEKGKYVTIYKKQSDGTWKVVEDIDNADGPSTPVATAKVTPKKAASATKKKKRKA